MTFDRFMKKTLVKGGCKDFCSREPDCDGYYTLATYCYVLGPDLDRGRLTAAGWIFLNGNGGVWPIARVGLDGSGATCFRKSGMATGNVRNAAERA